MVKYESLKLSTVQVLSQIYGTIEANSILRILHEDLFGNKNELNPEEIALFDNCIIRLQHYEPVQYITGITFFMGIKLMVNPAVLIPRFETEELCHQAITYLKNKNPKVLEVGTGSGCISIAIKRFINKADVFAIDISEDALILAKKNAVNHRLPISFIQNDFLDESKWLYLPCGLDLIISNPPYIRYSESLVMDKSTFRFEPHIALFAGDDPMIFYKSIARFGIRCLNSEGKIMVEINEFMSSETEEVFKLVGYTKTEIIKDINNKPRIIIAGK